MALHWNIIGASIQGTSHQKTDTPCQDAHAYRVLPDGTALIAVADGAGSAERSDQGAQLAVEQVIAAAEASLAEGMPADDAAWEALLTDAFCQARQALEKLAAADDVSSRAFATTLTCAVVANEWLAVAQIGDGVVVARDEDGELFAVTQPQRGEYANETYFLTMAEALQRVDVRVCRRKLDALAVMTDGLIRLAMKINTNEPHLPFFRPLFAFTAQLEDTSEAREQLQALLASDRVCERTDDDKTLVLAARAFPSTREAQHEDKAREDSDG